MLSSSLFTVSCNLKFNRVGCYKDKGKKQRPLGNYIMKDVKMSGLQKKSATSRSSVFDNTLGDFACRCANEALDRGNAVFGIQNIGKYHFVTGLALRYSVS